MIAALFPNAAFIISASSICRKHGYSRNHLLNAHEPKGTRYAAGSLYQPLHSLFVHSFFVFSLSFSQSSCLQLPVSLSFSFLFVHDFALFVTGILALFLSHPPSLCGHLYLKKSLASSPLSLFSFPSSLTSFTGNDMKLKYILVLSYVIIIWFNYNFLSSF